MTRPRPIEFWRTRAREGWSEWKAALDQAWAEIPAADKARVVASTPCEEAIQAYWKSGGDDDADPLVGVPCAWKDLFDLAGIPTGAGSTFLAGLRPTPTDHAEAVRRGLGLGLIPVAKTQLHEFAYGLTGENPHFGTCPHPHFKDRVSGGSSSGSAYLVGKGILPVAFGTDTGGSIRAPAAYCGLYGYRHVPGPWLEGCFPLAPSFDTLGWFTGNAGDMLTMLRAWNPEAKQSGNAPRSFQVFVPEDFGYTDRLHPWIDPLPAGKALDAREWNQLLAPALEAFVILQSAEAFAAHRSWIDERRDEYDPAVWERIARGGRWTATELRRARAFQAQCRERLEKVLANGPLLMPAVPTPAPRLNELSEALRHRSLTYTVLASLTGKACVTIPIPVDSLTLGLQVILRHPEDAIPTLESLLKHWGQTNLHSTISL